LDRCLKPVVAAAVKSVNWLSLTGRRLVVEPGKQCMGCVTNIVGLLLLAENLNYFRTKTVTL